MDVYVQVEKSGWLELPSDLLSQFGVSEGDLLAVRIENGSLILTRSESGHRLSAEPPGSIETGPANGEPSAKLGWEGQVLVVESPLTWDADVLLDQLREGRIREVGGW